MNLGLVLFLSGAGFAMGVASVLGFTRGIEGFLWLFVGLFCALCVAKNAPTRPFVNGALVGLIAGVAAPLIQAVFMDAYLANNPGFLESLPTKSLGPRAFVVALAPVIGAVGGIVLGAGSWLVTRVAGFGN